jgi:SulP family sulfate permease
LEKVFIKHINGPLFFGFTSDFQQLSKQIPKTAKLVLIRMDKVPLIDQSGLYALEDVIIDLEQQGIDVLLVGVQTQPKYLMKTIGIIGKLVEEEHLFENFADAKEWTLKYIESNPKL